MDGMSARTTRILPLAVQLAISSEAASEDV
jgi:hypothetical protein